MNEQLCRRNYKWQLHVSTTTLLTLGRTDHKYKRKFCACSLHTATND